MDERRKFPRFKVGVEVHWKKISSADEKTAQHISHVKDLSAGGVCLVLHPGIRFGDLLQLDIKLPSGKQDIHIKGRVVWMDYQARIPGRDSTACEGGIEFLELAQETRKQLESFTASSSHETRAGK